VVGGHLVGVGDVHDRDAVIADQPVHQLQDIGAAGRIEHGRALVADHHRGSAGEHAGHGEALEFPAGQRGRLPVGESGEPDTREQ
jgi:hypothetical protein